MSSTPEFRSRRLRRAGAVDQRQLSSEDEYKVGPGRPPREHQFKPGRSGNPKGAKRKAPPIVLDLKAALQRVLGKSVKLKQGTKERTVTMAVAGIEQLVAQFAKGDHRARRDLMALADKLGVDLVEGQRNTIEHALATNHQTILDGYVTRQTERKAGCAEAPVIAPADLLDDDSGS